MIVSSAKLLKTAQAATDTQNRLEYVSELGNRGPARLEDADRPRASAGLRKGPEVGRALPEKRGHRLQEVQVAQ